MAVIWHYWQVLLYQKCVIISHWESEARNFYLVFFCTRCASLHFLHSSTGRSGCKKYFSVPLMLKSGFLPARIMRLSHGQLSLMWIVLGWEGWAVHGERMVDNELFFSETLLTCCFLICWGCFNFLPNLNVSLTAIRLPATACRTSETIERSLSFRNAEKNSIILPIISVS